MPVIQSRSRLYESKFSEDDIFQGSPGASRIEQKGAGVRSYKAVLGWILSLIGISFKAKIDGKIYYLNTKSFCKLNIRNLEFKKIETICRKSSERQTLGAVAKSLNNIYKMHLKKGCEYDPARLKQFVSALKNRLSANKNVLILS